jgi:hypothetical protein
MSQGDGQGEKGDEEPDSDNDDEYQDLGAVKLGSEGEEGGDKQEEEEEEEDAEEGGVPVALRNKDEVSSSHTAA